MKNPNNIRLVATDLDGTLLNRAHEIPADNKAALECCIKEGIAVVVATGRAMSSIPQEVRDIDGIKYLVSANGANIYDNVSEERLYARFLKREAVESVWDLIENAAIMKELFWGGVPYTSRASYDDLARFGVPDWFREYVLSTRIPVDDLDAFAREHIDELENINFNYANYDIRDFLVERLKRDDGRLYTLTASLPFNIEVGGLGVDKASAVAQVAEWLGISHEECICFGDNTNDVSMIEWAGIGVAVSDGVPAALAAADYVTAPAAESGVARALENFGLYFS
ncbi:MAG: HAD family hydrolase [Clostridiales Family XIII bacterium]|jgi:Cof subfamily protein (haloacid dehalogenase superfamily)|nr:HAD family hydrolase [Clostridiales Family XIII bacterium]